MKTFESVELGLFLPSVLLPLHSYAADHGFQVFLAGGCVRDVVHDVQYRDVDVCVVGNYEGHQHALVDIVEKLTGGYEVANVYDDNDRDGYTEAFPEGEERYTEIIQLESLSGLPPVDLLFHVDQISNPWKVTAKQDHSINQFAAWVGSKDVVVAYLGDEQQYGICRQLREGVTEERISYVRGIAQILDWEYKTPDQLAEEARKQQTELDDLMESLL